MEEEKGLSPEARETLRRSQLFGLLGENDIGDIAALCREETYETGAAVCRQGERSTSLYVIARGSVFLERGRELGRGRRASITIATLRSGAVFGWASLLEPRGYTASAICREPTTVITIEGAELSSWIEAHPAGGCQLMRGLASLLAERLRDTYRAME